MRRYSQFKIENTFFILVIILATISIISISSAQELIPIHLPKTFAIKQILWYVIGFVMVYIIMYFGNSFVYQNAFILYILGVFLLILLLISPESIAPYINGSKSWFILPGIGSFQPSEFMKIFLILIHARIINDFNQKYLNPDPGLELRLIIKILAITAVPSILTFLQPDSGVVFIYLIITFAMIFASGIRIRWFLIFLSIGIVSLGSIIGLYLYDKNLFINIISSLFDKDFARSFFYRMDRLLQWSDKSGFQLEGALLSIGSAGFLGHGFKSAVNYFPEAQTDFIFAVFASDFGYVGATFLLMTLAIFDTKIIQYGTNSYDKHDKYVVSGIIAMLMYQQFQNIGMTFGVMPITGITLPFISYGGSSLLSYMFMLGLLFNMSNSQLRYTNMS